MMSTAIKDPATTALWEQGLDDIAQGKSRLETFTQLSHKFSAQDRLAPSIAVFFSPVLDFSNPHIE